MAALDVTRLSAKLKLMQAKLPVSFTFGALNLSGSKTEIDTETIYADHGYDSKYEFSIVAVKSDFTAGVPATGDKLTVGGTQYRVMKAKMDPGEIGVRIDLGSLYA